MSYLVISCCCDGEVVFNESLCVWMTLWQYILRQMFDVIYIGLLSEKTLFKLVVSLDASDDLFLLLGQSSNLQLGLGVRQPLADNLHCIIELVGL